MKNKIFASIIIPCYQEERFIEKCLISLIKNNYPKENFEILVIDGGSTDRTKEITEEFKLSNPKINIKLLDNPDQFQSFALNKGIKEAKGDIIIRCDAHAEYSDNYIEKAIYWLSKDKEIGNVGGVWINKPANQKIKTRAIAYTLSHPFCVGPNNYRIGSEKPKETDTVPFGAWRKEIFKELGLFNEDFLRAQDLEMNMKIKKAGYKIILDPEMKIYYYPRDNFKNLFQMMFQYGYWKNFVNKEAKTISSLRQLVPPLFVLYLFSLAYLLFLPSFFILPLIFYLFLTLNFSLSLSFKKRVLKVFPFSFLTFITSHLGYGLGYIEGFWETWVTKKGLGKKQSEITR